MQQKTKFQGKLLPKHSYAESPHQPLKAYNPLRGGYSENAQNLAECRILVFSRWQNANEAASANIFSLNILRFNCFNATIMGLSKLLLTLMLCLDGLYWSLMVDGAF